MSTPKTSASRVAFYQSEFGERHFNSLEHTIGRDTGMRVTIGNALECIEQGDPAEASVWVGIGQLISFRYRKLSN